MKHVSDPFYTGIPPGREAAEQELRTAEARFGLRLSARLDERARTVPHDISERLRVARETAVARARVSQRAAEAAPAVALGAGRRGAALGLGGGDSWWFRLSSVVPLLVLIVGLFLIQHLEGEEQILAAADVDIALLGDELPPDAYADPGFGEFLKSGGSLSAGAAAQ